MIIIWLNVGWYVCVYCYVAIYNRMLKGHSMSLKYIAHNKCKSIDNNLANYLDPVLGTFWRPRLLANCFLLFWSDLAVLIFAMLLADIQRPNWKSTQGPQLFNPFPLYYFTFIISHRINKDCKLKKLACYLKVFRDFKEKGLRSYYKKKRFRGCN